MNRMLRVLSASVAALALAPAANATVLIPDSSGVPFSPFDITTQGTLLDSITSGTTGATTYSGALRSAVYRNTFGTIDFYFQVALDAINPGDEVNNLTASDFTGYFIDALVSGADPDGAGGVFTAANNPNTSGQFISTTTASRNGSGQVVRADFGSNGLEAAGETSATYIFRTNASDYARGGTFTTQDGSVAQRANFRPVGAPVPEPATWALMLMGFGMIGFGLRRREKVTTRVRYSMA